MDTVLLKIYDFIPLEN